MAALPHIQPASSTLLEQVYVHQTLTARKVCSVSFTNIEWVVRCHPIDDSTLTACVSSNSAEFEGQRSGEAAKNGASANRRELSAGQLGEQATTVFETHSLQ